MKAPLIIVLLLISALPLLAQEQPEVWEVIDSVPRNTVPKAVTLAFKQRYPNVRPLFWFQLNDDYEAQFVIQERSMSAEFNKTGRWVNTETVLGEEDFPERVMDYVRQNYANFELNTVILEESTIGRFYDVTITNQDADQELVFDIHGNFLRKAEEPE